MMDVQRLIDEMSAQMAKERAETQMTLGGFIDLLKHKKQGRIIRGLGGLRSYRGYYTDLAFEPDATKMDTVAGILEQCQEAMGRTFTGYKGGDFIMHENTPLWVAAYGSTGVKFMGLESDYSLITEEETDV